MSTIKGQNLRLFVGDKAVAAATSCTLHVGTSFEDVSTKDDENPEWQSQELTQLSWDVQADALVEIKDYTEVRCPDDGPEGWYETTDRIQLNPGDTITVIGDGINVGIEGAGFVLAEGSGIATFGSNSNIEVLLLASEDGATVRYRVSSGNMTVNDFCDRLMTEGNLSISLSAKNGSDWEEQFHGNVKVSDISISAQVGQYATYSIQAQGIGSLEVN